MDEPPFNHSFGLSILDRHQSRLSPSLSWHSGGVGLFSHSSSGSLPYSLLAQCSPRFTMQRSSLTVLANLYGSLVLAVAVTVIEVALIVTLMIAGAGAAETLARDTVFAAVILTCNGIVGLSIVAGTRHGAVVSFNAEGAGAALATVATLSTLCLVVPTFTTGSPVRCSRRRSLLLPRSRRWRCMGCS